MLKCRVSIADVPNLSLHFLSPSILPPVTSDSVNTTRSPSIETLYTADPLNLTCVTKVNPAVDVPVVVTHQWTGRGVSSSSVSGVTSSGHTYTSMVMFNSLLSSHSGTYTCSSTVSPVGSPVFIESEAVKTSSITFSAGT